MAIKRALAKEQTEIRAALPGAYTKIHAVEIRTSDEKSVWIHALTFADAEARKDPDACSVNKETIKATLSDFARLGAPAGWTKDEIIAAAYRYLKSATDPAGKALFTGEDV